MDYYRIEWHDGLALGDERVDVQHRELIRRIAAIPDDQSPCAPALLEELFDYAAGHFAAEEAYMAELGFPELPAHRAVHRTLLRTLKSYRAEYEAGRHDLYSLKYFAFRWVRDHIMDDDRRIGEFARSTRNAS